MVNSSTMTGFGGTFSGLNSLQKLVLGENFDFNGDDILVAAQCAKLPNPAPIDGQATKWYHAANDTYDTTTEIPELNGQTVTYVAAIPPATP